MAESPNPVMSNLFAEIPHVMYCAKAPSGRYLAVNQAFVQRTNRRHPHQVIGRVAADLFPAELAATYEAQDQSVIHTGVPVRNQLEIITDPSGIEAWYLTTKVLDMTRRQISVVVVSVPVPLAPGTARADGLRAAVDLAQSAGDRVLTVGDLAAAAAMSNDQLERTMQRVLATSPKQYLLGVRVHRAARLLATTSLPIATIAATCGYYDQSQLCHQFKAATGVTPTAYRSL